MTPPTSPIWGMCAFPQTASFVIPGEVALCVALEREGFNMALWSRGEDRSDGEERILLQVLNDLTLPIFVIDAELSVLNLNDAARELAVARRGVWLLDGHLRVIKGEEQDGLVRIVGRVAGNASLSHCGYGLEVSADDEGPPSTFASVLWPGAPVWRAARAWPST